MTKVKNGITGSKTLRCALGVSLLLPFLMGGCPEFREDVVGVFETATRTALLSTEDAPTIVNVARVSLVDATIDLFFDQFRGDGD
jgi:hypothetical protein